jgi:hypothetical protein
MTHLTQGTSRVGTGHRLSLVAATATCVLALSGTGIAAAQTTGGAAGSQYTVPPVTTTSTTPSTTTTTPDTGVADNGGNTSTGDGSGDTTDNGGSNGTGNNGNGNNGTGNNGGTTGSGTGSNGAGTGSGSGAGTGSNPTGTLPSRVDYAAFGRLDKRVRNDIRKALKQGNLLYRYVKTTNKRLNTFIAGDAAKQLTTDGPRALGRQVGTVLTGSSPLAAGVFRTLFGTKFEYRPFVATVLSRGQKVKASHAAFLEGLAAGFGAKPVPTVYVERSDDKTPHVDEFKDIPGVSIVDDIDTPAGKAELVRLLTTGTNAAVADPAGGGSLFRAQKSAAIANVGDDSSSSMPMILLALVVVGGALFTGGTLVRRRR